MAANPSDAALELLRTAIIIFVGLYMVYILWDAGLLGDISEMFGLLSGSYNYAAFVV